MVEDEPDRQFYEERRLPAPEREYRPEGLGEFRRLVEGDDRERPAVLVGGGEHLRERAIARRPFDAIRTGGCSAVRSFDAESNVVRVEAGMDWETFRGEVRERDRSLARYRPHAEGATIGGLLARRRPLEKQLYTGDLLEGCIAMTTVAPGGDDYDYIPAPRKASGPDHRFLYIGGEGALGAILEATLVVWPIQPARLASHPAESAVEAVDIYRRIVARDLRPSWCHWSLEAGTFRAALHGPAPVLERHERALRSEFGAEFELQGRSRLREHRRAIERTEARRRSAPEAERTWRVSWNIEALADEEALREEQLEELVLDRWSRRRVGGHVVAADGEAARDAGPEELAVRRVVDDGEASWPDWMVDLKRDLDPQRRLAVGP